MRASSHPCVPLHIRFVARDSITDAFLVWLSTTTAVDVLIAGSILYGLLKYKNQGWVHTDKVGQGAKESCTPGADYSSSPASFD
jgi:hypothetical protein